MKNHVTAIMRRFTDIVASTTFLILLAPIFFFIGIFIKSVSAGPIFDRKIYKKDSNEITLFRFRTTHLDSDQLIPFGDILKISSLEELPLFLNVLKGDISLFIGLSRIKLIDYSLLEKARSY